MANRAARVGGQDVGRILDPWRTFIERVVDGSKRRVFLRCEGDVLPADAVDDDGNRRLHGGVHGCRLRYGVRIQVLMLRIAS